MFHVERTVSGSMFLHSLTICATRPKFSTFHVEHNPWSGPPLAPCRGLHWAPLHSVPRGTQDRGDSVEFFDRRSPLSVIHSVPRETPCIGFWGLLNFRPLGELFGADYCDCQSEGRGR
jgi:hypothetical protein